MSDAFLVLAQAEDGLSCFLVPRMLPDGNRNAIRLVRLKDKLGNRSNATAEAEFDGAAGWLVGEAGGGIPTIIDMVTLTRLDFTGLVSPAGHPAHTYPGPTHSPTTHPMMRNGPNAIVDPREPPRNMQPSAHSPPSMNAAINPVAAAAVLSHPVTPPRTGPSFTSPMPIPRPPDRRCSAASTPPHSSIPNAAEPHGARWVRQELTNSPIAATG
jgi:hypothetical protein